MDRGLQNPKWHRDSSYGPTASSRYRTNDYHLQNSLPKCTTDARNLEEFKGRLEKCFKRDPKSQTESHQAQEIL